MENTVDLLQIKIEKAKTELSEESRQAIDAIDWKNVIIGMRVEKGYSFTQIEDLELETELLLCGLLNPEDYPKELEKRMGIPKPQVNELVNEMNIKIFSKIREELVKNIERKKISENKQIEEFKKPENNLESREELLKKIENPESINNYELRINNEKKNNEQLGITNYELEITDGKPTKTITDDQLRIKNLEEKNEKTQSILGQKLSGVFQVPKTETDHSLGNISPNNTPSSVPKVDPYREPTE